MSKGISKQQKRIIDMVSIHGTPEGLTRGVLQAQLWPDIFCKDYRFTAKSAGIVKEKAKCRVILSRAIGSLIKRGLIAETDKYERLPANEVHRRGLALPYALQTGVSYDITFQANGTCIANRMPAIYGPNNGYDLGRLLTASVSPK